MLLDRLAFCEVNIRTTLLISINFALSQNVLIILKIPRLWNLETLYVLSNSLLKDSSIKSPINNNIQAVQSSGMLGCSFLVINLTVYELMFSRNRRFLWNWEGNTFVDPLCTPLRIVRFCCSRVYLMLLIGLFFTCNRRKICSTCVRPE